VKRLALLLLLVLVPAPSAALADGCPLPCSGQSASPPDSKLLYVQADGSRGLLVAYSTATRQAVFALPPGMASADGRTYFSASFGYEPTTVLKRWAVATAQQRGEWVLPGRWTLQGVSPTGRWAALARRAGQDTRLLVFDARSGERVHVMRLRGNYEVETISRDGKRLFLIEHFAGRQYNVRQYDLSRERLVANPLRAEGVKIMAGYAWSGVASPDGRWLLTLYLSTPGKLAFVHSLDLERSRPACIGLPSGNGGAFEHLKRYSLTLSPDSGTLYAANPALGVVAELDLARSEVKRVARFEKFAPVAGAHPATLSTISRNGRTMYFSAGRDLWAYDAAYGVVRGPYATGGKVVGVGYGAGDQRVFAVRKDGHMIAFRAANGARVT
jgi:hypothetical protein